MNTFWNMKRRTFLKGGSSFVAAAALVSPASALRAFAQAPAKTVITAAHWGPLEVTVENGKITGSGPALADRRENYLQSVVADQVHHRVRVKQPMVRKGFLDGLDDVETPDGKRGKDEFVAVSWERAYDLVEQQLRRVRQEHGAKSIWGGSYGWYSSGSLHAAQTLLQRFLRLTGGYVDRVNSYSTGAISVIMPHIMGNAETTVPQTTWPVILEHSDVVMIMSANPMNTLEIAWTSSDEKGRLYFEKLRDSGKRIIIIDPMYSETARFFGDRAEWIAPNPTTDVPLMLGIAHELLTTERHDQAFLDEYTVGFERFAAYLRGEDDGTEKTPEWAANICDVPADKIRELATLFADNRTMLMAGWAMQRADKGEQTHWTLVTLAAMLGQIGLPGGGFGFSYHYSNGGVPPHEAIVVPGISATPDAPHLADQIEDTSEYTLPVARIVEALENPGDKLDYNGGQVTLPDIRLIWWCGGNPFHHHQDTNRLRRAWQKPEVVIVSEPYWTATAKHADIVLPITTSYERDDITMTGDFSNMHIVPMKKVVEPQHEARDDYEVFRELSARFGVEQEYSEGRTQMGWIKHFYEQAADVARAKRVRMPRFQQFWEENAIIKNPVDKSRGDWVRHADFREDPVLNPLGTPSGKIEIFSETIDAMNYDDCLGHPSWLEPVEYLGNATPEHPIHLMTPHLAYRLHSQLNYTRLRDEYAVANREPVFLHPEDAAERGIADGDLVRVYNDRGQILCGAVLDEGIKRRVIAIHEGAWYDPADDGDNALCKNGNMNVLVVDRGTSKLAQGTCGYTALVQFEKFTGTAPELTAFEPPIGAA
ncbi:molybdopterin guanine dinucleotide-containing S/N-oxide reductase [Halomonas piscis]|uniref:trimethylamine-N-oxide reductase n=1 Tax=Halomonas piscis TaxID=3031727 RepID=A0ABY9Z3L1_9GAMM|nr:molybdopterin guanine dinucleotide-containing S/N-oxide reductase [Halomonas piscis]WNK20818.1 molybdopterin guanine dinucleotide-containing S/N-oxide reductase [Halomonas piscis]